MAGIAQRLKAVLVVSLRSQCRPRWVWLSMFLLGCTLTKNRLYNAQPHDVTELSCMKFSVLFELFFRKVTYFAKTFQFQPNNSIYQPFFRVNNEF